jgi:hypothetical protein
MNAGFIQTRRTRRKIIQILQTQQEVDATAASLLKAQFLEGYRKLLHCIGEFLSGYGSEVHFKDGVFTCTVDDEAAALFKSVAGTVSLEEWSGLRIKETELTFHKLYTQQLLAMAEKAHEEVAPFGFLSKIGITDAEKTEIDKRKSAKNALKTKLQEIEKGLENLHVKQQETAQAFLRNATSPESIEILAKCSPIQNDMSQILSDSAEALTKIWGVVSTAQEGSLAELEGHLNILRSTYSENFSTQTAIALGKGE